MQTPALIAVIGCGEVGRILAEDLPGGGNASRADAVNATGVAAGRGWHPSLGYRGLRLSPVPELPSLRLAAMGLLAVLGWTKHRPPA